MRSQKEVENLRNEAQYRMQQQQQQQQHHHQPPAPSGYHPHGSQHPHENSYHPQQTNGNDGGYHGPPGHSSGPVKMQGLEQC